MESVQRILVGGGLDGGSGSRSGGASGDRSGGASGDRSGEASGGMSAAGSDADAAASEGLIQAAATHVAPDAAIVVPPAFERVLDAHRAPLAAHLWRNSMGGHSRAVFLELAALLHDIGKPVTDAAAERGLRREPHGEVGADRATSLAERLRFGAVETDYLATVVRLHPRPLVMARSGGATRRDVYRFFSDAGAAGVDVALLAFADNSVKPHHTEQLTEAIASVVDRLLASWFEERAVAVDPVPLVSGGTVMDALQLEPGPEVGRILASIREAQAVGDVDDAAQALDLARRLHGGGPQ
jgi:hypothetical protein